MSHRWALLIGINHYHESLGSLKYAVNDVRRLAEVLGKGMDAIPSDRMLILTDDQPDNRHPTYGNIQSWLASWLSRPKDDDMVMVYFAGHGREIEGKCYLAPGDATLQTLHVTGIPVGFVQDLLNRCKARQKVLILDACHSGAGRDVATMSPSLMDQISAGRGIYTITSCDTEELSHEWEEKKQGVFSYYLAEALSGSCPPDVQGRISADAVYDWVYHRVQHWASESRCIQNPKRVSNVSGTIMLRQADPDWKALAHSLQAKLNNSETTSAHIQEKLDNAREREQLLVKLRQSAREQIISGDIPRTKTDQKKLLNSIISSDKLHLATQDEMLTIIADEAARASAVQDAVCKARKEFDSLLKVKDIQKTLGAAEKQLDKAYKEKEQLLRIQGSVWRKVLFGFIFIPLGLCLFGLVLNVSLLPLLALPLVICGFGGLLFPWKGKRWSLAAAILSFGIFGFVVLTMWLRPHPLAFSMPLFSNIVQNDVQSRLQSVEELIRSQDWQAAKNEAEGVEELLRHAGGGQASELRAKAISVLGTDILPQWYTKQIVWEGTRGALMAWDENAQLVRHIATFESIDQILLSPDKSWAAVVVDRREALIVVDLDSTYQYKALGSLEEDDFKINRWAESHILDVSYRDNRPQEYRNPKKRTKITIRKSED